MCQAIKELIEDSKAEGRKEGIKEGRTKERALTIKITNFILANPNATDKTVATTCECGIDDVIEIRTALNL